MDGRYLVGAISILVTVILVGSVMMPIMDYSTSGEDYEDNPDWDGWIKFDLNRSASSYEISITQDENGIYVGNGTDIQTYDDSNTGEYATIFYADSNNVIWSDDGNGYNIMGKINGSPFYLQTTDDLTVSSDANGVSVSVGGDSYVLDSPTWSYVPKSTGSYGFYPYDEERGVKVSNAPVAVVGGGFAGVYAYNDVYRYDGLGLTMSQIVEDGMFYGASWGKTATVDTQNEEPTDNTFDPSVIQPIDDPFNTGMGLMAVPTPTYTDGDWGYDLITVDDVQKAVIVSYSGAGGNIVIPATVGGYDVYRVGKLGLNDTGTAQVINNSSISSNSSITLPNGIKEIGKTAFFQCSNIANSLIIPEGVEFIGENAFNGCRFSNTLTIPESVTFIGNNAFRNCRFTGSLVIPDSITSIGQFTFGEWNYIRGTLVIPNSVTSIEAHAFYKSKFTGTLVIPESVTSIGSEAFGDCSGFTGTLVIPNSVTSIGQYVFNDMTGIDSVVISSDAIPEAGIFHRTTGITEVLDLSDTVDYSVDRNGLADSVTVSDSIGDCFGFISSTVIPVESGGGLSNFKVLLYTIPVLVLAGLLVATAAIMIHRDY